MTPHHKPKNVTLTRIARLSKGNMRFIKYMPDTASDRTVAGQHLGFEVSVQALLRSRGMA